MWSFKPSISNADAHMLTVVCGGVAFLIALAVWIAPNSDIFISNAAPEQNLAAVSATPKVIRLAALGAHNWVVPADWNDTNNKVEIIGAGGGGSSGQNGAGGGGGGAYVRVTNLNLTPGAAVRYVVGAGGIAGFSGQSGKDTMFNQFSGNGISCGSGMSACADSGKGGIDHNGGAGGLAASSVGAVKYNGGKGGSRDDGGCDGCTSGSDEGSGGGGAAGAFGAGLPGRAGGAGGRGDANRGGIGGAHGCGVGGNGTEMGGGSGAGGGGGGGGDDASGCNGGSFGGGGGGKGDDGFSGGVGRQGQIIITYYPLTVAAFPTMTITANSGSGTVTAFKDTSITIRATFAPGTGDVLRGTAINGPAPYTYALVPSGFAWVSAPGLTTAPASTKTYTFTPTQTGDYTFIPAAITTDHLTPWYDANKFVTVHVVCNGACTCPANNTLVNGVCVPNFCDPGFHLVGSVCVPDATSCATGYHLVGGICVANGVTDVCLNMPGAQSVVPTNCKLEVIPSGTQCVPINSGYRISGAACVPKGTISAFFATPSRLRAGDGAMLTWTVSGMVGGCGVSATSGGDPAPMTVNNGLDGSHTATIDHVNQITTYRLTCNDSVETFVNEKTINVVPQFEEI